MHLRRWWPVPTVLVYVLLAGITWTFERGAYAASRYDSRSAFHEMKAKRGSPRRRAPRRSSRAQKIPFSSIHRTAQGYSLAFGFKNFNGDKLTLKTQLSAQAVAASIREFGYDKDDFAKLDAWYKKAQKRAIARSEQRFISGKVQAKDRRELASKMAWINDHNATVQKELDRELDDLTKQYRRRRLGVYDKAGFRYKSKGIVEVDIPGLVKRNWKRMRPVARGFSAISDRRGYDAEDLVGAVVAMVQTSMRYEIPGTQEGRRVIGGVLPPPKSFVLGQGDCDTKTAVISSILMNWPNLRMVGLAIPGHYLMAVHRIPRSGEVFIEYEGIPYVMIESAGPAWLSPGTVGDDTMAYLQSGRNFRIQPIVL